MKNDGSRTDSTEIIHFDGTQSAGISLPYETSSHCMVTLEDGRIMTTGGEPKSQNGRKVWILDVDVDDGFIAGPDMIYKRFNHACATFRSPFHNNREVVLVAGGTKRDEVELLDFQKNVWVESM